jgi:hypothetical protein
MFQLQSLWVAIKTLQKLRGCQTPLDEQDLTLIWWDDANQMLESISEDKKNMIQSRSEKSIGDPSQLPHIFPQGNWGGAPRCRI